MDQVGTVDNREDLTGIVVGDQDADLLLFEDADEVFDVGDSEGIDVRKGLVEEEERGLGHEGAGDLETAPLASREAGCDFLPEMLEVELFEKRVELRFAVGDGERFKDAEDVVFDRKGTEDRGLLGKVAKAELGPFVDGERGDVLPFEIDFPFVGLDKSDGHVKSGGFTGAVRAEKANYFSWLDVE